MNAANTHTFTASTIAGFPPAPPEAHQRAGELKSALEYIQSFGYSAEIKGDSVEVQDPYYVMNGGNVRRFCHEPRQVYSLRAAVRFVSQRQ